MTAAAPVRVSKDTAGAGWAPSDLDDLLPDVEHLNGRVDHIDVEEIPEKLPADVKSILADPADIADADRSARLMGLVAACRRAGFTDGQTLTICRLWKPGVAKYGRRIDEQIGRCLANTRAKVNPETVEDEPGPEQSRRHLKSGGQFVLDDPADLAPILGSGDEVLWASGEPCLIVGPTGVGKTTLAMQLVAGRLGIIKELLGYPIADDDRPVLYLAMDRPRQIRRAMRRIFGEEHRQVLDERLKVWEGPLPADLGKAPLSLLNLVEDAAAGTVVVDSLKDAAVKLTDDEVGGNLNRAFQHCVTAGVEVLGLHHQRKSQGGTRPSTLEDVYGSTWIAAGAGSVILLWGAAGDPLVDLFHLKQPASEVGPLKIEHDHHAGLSSIYRGQVDPLVMLRNAGPNGLVANQLAGAMFETMKPTDNQRKKAQRQLDRLVREGHAHLTKPVRAGDGGVQPGRYNLVETRREDSPK